MTVYTRRAIIVVTAAVASTANNKAKEVDVAGGEKTFTVGLVPAGSPPGTPPTHLWCSWQMTGAEWAAITSKLRMVPLAAVHVKVYDGNARTPESVLAELGLDRARSIGAI